MSLRKVGCPWLPNGLYRYPNREGRNTQQRRSCFMTTLLWSNRNSGTVQRAKNECCQSRAAFEPLCLTPVKPPEVVVARLVLLRPIVAGGRERLFDTQSMIRRPKSGVGGTGPKGWCQACVKAAAGSGHSVLPRPGTPPSRPCDTRFSPLEGVTLSANDGAGVYTLPAIRSRGSTTTSAARWKFLSHLPPAASGFPVLVHLNGLAMVRLKYAMNCSIRSLRSCCDVKLPRRSSLRARDGEPNLDLIEPRRMLGGEMEADPVGFRPKASRVTIDSRIPVLPFSRRSSSIPINLPPAGPHPRRHGCSDCCTRSAKGLLRCST
jgi:hypothetical protein